MEFVWDFCSLIVIKKLGLYEVVYNNMSCGESRDKVVLVDNG